MSMFTLTITTDNAAFADDDPGELVRLVRRVADKLDSGVWEGSVRDVNGNTVGAFSWARPPL